MKKKILYSLLLFVFLLNGSIRKKKLIHNKLLHPTITINDPKELSYNLGDTVSIDVIVNDATKYLMQNGFLFLNPQNEYSLESKNTFS